MNAPPPSQAGPEPPVRSDLPFYIGLFVLSGLYVFLISAMLLADLAYTTPGALLRALTSPETRYAIKLSLVSCTITTIFSLWVAAPTGYLLSRYKFRGKALLDSVLDIPIVLPPLVVGLSLLILFRTAPGIAFETLYERATGARITYAVAGVVLAQFMVACAFAVRTMRATFDGISPRREQVALTLGCSRGQAFWSVALPEARKGIVVAATLAWARSLGEFGPILIFAGATRLKTEVLSTTVFLEMSVGNVEAAVAVSLLMIIASLFVLVIVRVFGYAEYVR
ncbi:MAG TPA: ABC transporter permease [Candidatus Hydrogenedentes bacterium]|nr:ABC transporter permease [Candidatus Hydrogenedentota bacterium]HNT86726.1 ABC transporter permease [Candidatus Hydrogenedentota bacterium]